jgi:hypothetical protein
MLLIRRKADATEVQSGILARKQKKLLKKAFKTRWFLFEH